MPWDEIVKEVTPYIVKIETPSGHGTGFLCFYNSGKNICFFATAKHVVEYAHKWEQPIRIIHPASGNTAFLQPGDRYVNLDSETDSAVVMVYTKYLSGLPPEPLPLLPDNKDLPIGSEVAWLGFPGIVDSTLCFFSGMVSATISHGYLIDGVAINGVSGGPVFHCLPTKGVQIVGAISAYAPNRATGDVLPGLAVAQDISHFQTWMNRVKSVDEEQRRKELDEAKKIVAEAESQKSSPAEKRAALKSKEASKTE
jgi:hypothetical protein